jgi:hypothetical protein
LQGRRSLLLSHITEDHLYSAYRTFTVAGNGRVEAQRGLEREASQPRDQVREALKRDLEAARYATDRAFRQYDAADPANRLVAGELEAA